MNPAQVTVFHPRNLGALIRDSTVREFSGLESGLGLALGDFRLEEVGMVAMIGRDVGLRQVSLES